MRTVTDPNFLMHAALSLATLVVLYVGAVMRRPYLSGVIGLVTEPLWIVSAILFPEDRPFLPLGAAFVWVYWRSIRSDRKPAMEAAS